MNHMLKMMALLVTCHVGVAGGQEQRGEWVKLLTKSSKEVGARSFSRIVSLPGDRMFIWGPPGENPATDWCTAAFNLAADSWEPLIPEGK